MNTLHSAVRSFTGAVALAVAAILAVAAGVAPPPARGGIVYEMVTVGDPGNAADATALGGVAYAYRIGKHEVTIAQYAEFLNAVAKADPYSLYNPSMGSSQAVAGIARSGTSGSYTYAVVGPVGSNPPGASSPGDRPITYVTWFDAARFANWISNGQPTGPQGGTTTENGAYTLNGAVSGPAPAKNAVNPNTGAAPLYHVPLENEWYKAAYYKGGGTNAGYWAFATQSDTAPGNLIGGLGNQANYYTGAGFAVTQTASFSFTNNYLTERGAFAASPSAYGTFDQSGNVWEWTDLVASTGTSQRLRGGSWRALASSLSSAESKSLGPTSEGDSLGFRLASPVGVPEPSTWATGAAGLACGAWAAWRRRRRGRVAPRSPRCLGGARGL